MSGTTQEADPTEYPVVDGDGSASSSNSLNQKWLDEVLGAFAISLPLENKGQASVCQLYQKQLDLWK